MKLTDVSNSTSEFILQALLKAQQKDSMEVKKIEEKLSYELNPADVIKEEDFEESLGEMSAHKPLNQLSRRSMGASEMQIMKFKSEEVE